MQKLPPPRVTTPDMRTRFPIEQLTGLSLVLALHAAALYGLWSARDQRLKYAWLEYATRPATRHVASPASRYLFPPAA